MLGQHEGKMGPAVKPSGDCITSPCTEGGTLKNQVRVPENLLAIARPLEEHRMHQEGPELVQDGLKLLTKAGKMVQHGLGTGTLKIQVPVPSTDWP